MRKTVGSRGFTGLRLACVSALLAAVTAATGQALAAEGWVATRTRAHDVRGARHLGVLAESTEIPIVVSLNLRNRKQLDTLTAGLIAGAPGVHPLSSQQFLDRHAPTASQADAVAAYLRAQGFHDVEVAGNRLLVSATGSARSIRRAFQSELHAYDAGGRSAYANATDALVPQSLSEVVLAVVGLQTVHVAQTPARARVADTRTTGTQALTGTYPTDFASVYGAAGLPSAANATIGIIVQGSVTQTIADLNTFAAGAGYPAPSVTTTLASTNASVDTINMVEWNIDSQAALAAAGGTIGSMILYDVLTLADASLTQGYNRAVADNLARVINVSLQACETHVPASVIATDDQIFQAAVAQGQMFSVATGDHGAYICGNTSTTAGQSYPATSPWVMAVGGTSLDHTGGVRNSETAWAGSGGGPSAIEPAPAWQLGAGVLGTSTRRGVPDIAFDADPGSGIAVLVNGGYQQWGGTSLSAPIWAGFWARIQSMNGNALPFPAPAIYAGAATHPEWFNDIVSGNQGYGAATGWDYASGWGSLQVGNLATGWLIGSAAASSSSR